MQINTTSDALDNLNKKLGGADIEIEPSTNKVDALKKIYKTLGGADDVAGLSTVYQVLEKITEVAEGGGGGGSLPSVTAADAGKVLAVNASGEWTAEIKLFNVRFDDDDVSNLTPRDAIALFGSGVLIAEMNGYIDPDNPQFTSGMCRFYISTNYNDDEHKYALYNLEGGYIVADDLDSPFYID